MVSEVVDCSDYQEISKEKFSRRKLAAPFMKYLKHYSFEILAMFVQYDAKYQRCVHIYFTKILFSYFKIDGSSNLGEGGT